MGASAYVLTRPLGEIDLTGARTDAQRQLLAATRAGLDRRYRLAGLLLGNAADAEDATQEAMLRAWRSAASLRDVGRVDAWLDGILVNVCRDRMRRRRIVRFIPLADGIAGVAHDQFQSVLDRDEVVRAMRDLDADQRIVVVLHYWGGLTLEGIADRLGWPVGTVKSRLHHALRRMRTTLDVPLIHPDASA
ncbi:MAG: RNA polymerase sigma factor [Chloroflexi bacterium]|nr:RNA polymerase sigma factor [Chloroflexota bacterium]